MIWITGNFLGGFAFHMLVRKKSLFCGSDGLHKWNWFVWLCEKLILLPHLYAVFIYLFIFIFITQNIFFIFTQPFLDTVLVKSILKESKL